MKKIGLKYDPVHELTTPVPVRHRLPPTSLTIISEFIMFH